MRPVRISCILRDDKSLKVIEDFFKKDKKRVKAEKERKDRLKFDTTKSKKKLRKQRKKQYKKVEAYY